MTIPGWKMIVAKNKIQFMKRLLIIVCVSIISFYADAQLRGPSPGKAVVYFVRVSDLGFAINFSYFDSATFIGIASGRNYFRYECDPGWHLFWARSENKAYVEADLEEGKIYFIEVVPQMGALKASVDLYPVHPIRDEKYLKKILKMIDKQNSELMTEEKMSKYRERLKETVDLGLDKYWDDKKKGKKMTQLTREYAYER